MRFLFKLKVNEIEKRDVGCGTSERKVWVRILNFGREEKALRLRMFSVFCLDVVRQSIEIYSH